MTFLEVLTLNAARVPAAGSRSGTIVGYQPNKHRLTTVRGQNTIDAAGWSQKSQDVLVSWIHWRLFAAATALSGYAFQASSLV